MSMRTVLPSHVGAIEVTTFWSPRLGVFGWLLWLISFGFFPGRCWGLISGDAVGKIRTRLVRSFEWREQLRCAPEVMRNAAETSYEVSAAPSIFWERRHFHLKAVSRANELLRRA